MLLLAALAFAAPVLAASQHEHLKKIDNVILFMQENRGFDHYFGTMAGVRGFQDPNAVPGVFNQAVNSSVKPKPPHGVDHLKPWQLTKDPDYKERAQCMVAGSNGWEANHAAWNDGKIDSWALANTPYSIGYYARDDVAVQFSLAENFLVGDAYYESLIGASDTNRAIWFSGTINSPGSNIEGHSSDVGGPVVDDHRAPGCEKDVYGNPMSCLPLKWKTVPEYLQENNITWRVYEDTDNMFHNTLEQWQQYEQAIISQNELAKRGIYRPGVQKFFADIANGSLPEVSYIITPTALSEHPPNTPQDGGWFQRKVAEAVMKSPKYNSTVLIVSYDETGGFSDHVLSPLAPKDTPGEWMKDPFNKTAGLQPIGPGFRVPFYIVSPWTRNGGVFTEVAAHESQILFLEEWAKARGKGFHTKEMNTWRRKHMSNLVSAFDFENPDYSKPNIARVKTAHRDPVTGDYDGSSRCLHKYDNDVTPPVPYKNQTDDYLNIEKGHKRVRGHLSEGRYLIFTAHGKQLSHKEDNKVALTGKNLKDRESTFVLHWQGKEPKDNGFKISTGAGKDAKYIAHDLTLSGKDDGIVFNIKPLDNAGGYHVIDSASHKKISIDGDKLSLSDDATAIDIFSVSI